MPVSQTHTVYLACGAREAFTPQAFARHSRARKERLIFGLMSA